jgi:hypothetical protein
MKVYIAAKYSRRYELRALRDALQVMGHPVTAQWLDNAEESKGLAQAAEMDVDDVLRADALLFMGEPRGSQNRGGGRWFEFGVAYQAGKVCYVICPPSSDPSDERRDESVFTHLPSVIRFNDIEHFLDYMKEHPSA